MALAIEAIGPAPRTDAEQAPAEAYLHLDRVEKRYGDIAAVADLSLSVRQGEFIALLGPSGCGKTTTLRMIAGLVSVGSGTISIGGRDVTRLPPYLRDIGLVFQNYALFPHMTVAENVAFGLEMRKVPKAEAAVRVQEALALVRLSEYGGRRPRELSGGQQQRVALARALVIRPSLLLLDEPLSNLDAKLREEMRFEIRDIQKRLGITALFVTHDQAEALSMCDRVAVMDRGCLRQVGTPYEIYERPQHPFIAEFVGRINKLPGIVHGSDAQVGPFMFKASGLPRAGTRVVVMVRPHRIQMTPKPSAVGNGNNVRGRVTRIVYVGDVIQYEVDIGPAAVQVERPTTAGPQSTAVGDEVFLEWSVADTLVFEQAV